MSLLFAYKTKKADLTLSITDLSFQNKTKKLIEVWGALYVV